jgi:hypothetical protein
MRFPTLARLVTLAAVLLPVVFAAPADQATYLKIRNAEARDVIPNSYIIVYKEGVSSAAIAAHESSISSALKKRASTMQGIGPKWDMTSFKGYQIEADAATIQQIAAAPEVSRLNEAR